ncbi:MAG: hypothetical protein HN348_21545 [Proteobacteria bacterium]|nr:hypothetical protein [Pseudomonadota bacterium]
MKRLAVLLGDSAGFIDPFGSSGIYFSMAMAKHWVEMIGEQMDCQRDVWTGKNVAQWRRRFSKTKVLRRIRSSYFKVGLLERYVFCRRRTARRINHRWRLISFLIRLG